jgi:hypothetical protein
MSKLSVHETEQENENAGSPTLQQLPTAWGHRRGPPECAISCEAAWTPSHVHRARKNRASCTKGKCGVQASNWATQLHLNADMRCLLLDPSHALEIWRESDISTNAQLQRRSGPVEWAQF